MFVRFSTLIISPNMCERGNVTTPKLFAHVTVVKPKTSSETCFPQKPKRMYKQILLKENPGEKIEYFGKPNELGILDSFYSDICDFLPNENMAFKSLVSWDSVYMFTVDMLYFSASLSC